MGAVLARVGIRAEETGFLETFQAFISKFNQRNYLFKEEIMSL